jgi:hypothetical protein
MKLLFLLLVLVCIEGRAQSPVVTAFPSLRIPASSRGLAMGDAGIGSAVENQQLWYNVAKSAFIQNFHQASVSYMPWMNGVSNDTRFISLNYLGNVLNTSAFGVAVNYLNLGSITMRDNNGAAIAQYNAREYSVGASYALQVNEQTSLGVTLRLLGQNSFSDVVKNVFSVCGDVSYYQFASLGGGKLEWGAKISNFGPKIDYGGAKTFLPSNLGVGISYSNIAESGSEFTVAMDVNKLLVPSEDPDKGILAGMFSSFAERDQMSSLRLSSGIEYGYMNRFFLRGGLSLENALRGNRKYFGFGVGYKGLVLDQSWGIDFHYLVPFGTVAAVSPFQNCLGFTLAVNFGNFQ